jgi:hypothetical protein
VELERETSRFCEVGTFSIGARGHDRDAIGDDADRIDGLSVDVIRVVVGAAAVVEVHSSEGADDIASWQTVHVAVWIAGVEGTARIKGASWIEWTARVKRSARIEWTAWVERTPGVKRTAWVECSAWICRAMTWGSQRVRCEGHEQRGGSEDECEK